MAGGRKNVVESFHFALLVSKLCTALARAEVQTAKCNLVPS
jgi:hypothetical protein